MKKFRKVENNIDDDKILQFDKIEFLEISNIQLENEKPFNFLKKQGDFVLKGEKILENERGECLLSPVSGKVKKIWLKEDIFNDLCQHILIKNDFKNEEFKLKKIALKNKENLIKIVKEFGIINNGFSVIKYFENLKNNLIINAFDNAYIFNNYVCIKNFKNELKSVLNTLKNVLNLNKIYVHINKKNKTFFNENLDLKNLKFICKKPKKNAINLYDLYKIFNAINGKFVAENLISVTGKALQKNTVILAPIGIKIQEFIDFCGGFKENIEEVEDFKYLALCSFNDEMILIDKIKNCKNEIDKSRLQKLLKEKQLEAKTNIFDKLGVYHKKYLNCLSACFLNGKNKKLCTKNFNATLQSSHFGLHLLNNEQFN